jgi:hypothetical protein
MDLLQSSIWPKTCTTNQITQQLAKLIVGLRLKELTLNFVLEIQNGIRSPIDLQIQNQIPSTTL